MLCLTSEYSIEDHIKTVMCGSIKQSPLWNVYAEHFLQAYRLCAKLDFIASVALWPPALVFNRKWLPSTADIIQLDAAFAHPLEFHDISDA